MKPVSVAYLVAVAVVSAGCAALINSLLIQHAFSPIVVSYFLSALYVLIAAALGYYGVHVRRWRAHKSTKMDALTAARVAVTARACAYVGSGSVGVMVGIMLPCLTRIDAPAMQMCIPRSVLGALTGLVVTIVAFIVERWCVVDMSDDDDAHPSHPSHPSPTTSPA